MTGHWADDNPENQQIHQKCEIKETLNTERMKP